MVPDRTSKSRSVWPTLRVKIVSGKKCCSKLSVTVHAMVCLFIGSPIYILWTHNVAQWKLNLAYIPHWNYIVVNRCFRGCFQWWKQAKVKHWHSPDWQSFDYLSRWADHRSGSSGQTSAVEHAGTSSWQRQNADTDFSQVWQKYRRKMFFTFFFLTQ